MYLENSDQRAKVRRGWVVTLSFSAALIPWFVWDDLRHVIYVVPALALMYGAMTVVGTRGYVVDKRALLALLVYLSICALSLASSGVYTGMTARDISLIAAPFLTLLIPLVITAEMVGVMFAAYAVVLIATAAGLTRKVYISSAMTHDYSDLLASKGIAETAAAFPLGALFLYYLSRNNYVMAVISLLMVFMAAKRIVFAGVLAGGVAYYLFSQIREAPENWKVKLIAALYGAALFGLAMNMEAVADHAIKIAGLNINADQLTLGRVSLGKVIEASYSRGDEWSALFGHGPGGADDLLARSGYIFQKYMYVKNIDQTNPHNDFLKLKYDYGYIGMLGYLTACYIFMARNRFGAAMLIYNITMLPTDNTIIYYQHQLCAILVVKASQRAGHATAGMDWLKKTALSMWRARRSRAVFK